jgi:hypothetical protein
MKKLLMLSDYSGLLQYFMTCTVSRETGAISGNNYERENYRR